MKKWFISILALMCFSFNSCDKQKKKPYQPTSNLKELIAGDSLKTWKIAKRYNGKTRMNMGDCFLKYRQSFFSNGGVSDNNEDQSNCGSSLIGAWSIIKDSASYTYIRIISDDIPELLNIEENYKDFRVFYASEDSLHIYFIHTQYGQERRISDYLVQEEVSVPNRNFHFK